MKNKTNEYSDLFSLENRTAFIVGGKGLLGLEITKAISTYDAKTIVLDIDEKLSSNLDNIIYKNFDCSNLNNIETSLNDIINEFGCPDIFINCSYPINENWKNSSFQEIQYDNSYLYIPICLMH